VGHELLYSASLGLQQKVVVIYVNRSIGFGKKEMMVSFYARVIKPYLE